MRSKGTARVRRRALVAVVTGALLGPAFAAAQASAATISTSAPCYVNTNSKTGAPIDVLGSGFTPGDTIQVSSGVDVSATTTAGPDGSINLITAGPTLGFDGPGTKTFTLQARDQTANSGSIASTSLTMANFSVATTPSTAAPSRKITWHFSGFLPGRTIYVHYLHRSKVLQRMAFGRAQAPCGTLSARDRFYPGGHPRYSTYKVVFDQVRRYTASARPRISTMLSFF